MIKEINATIRICEDKVYALNSFLHNTRARFSNKEFHRCHGIPMKTNCASLIVDLFDTTMYLYL